MSTTSSLPQGHGDRDSESQAVNTAIRLVPVEQLRTSLKGLRSGHKPMPERAVFMNAGVKLTTEGSELLDEIRALEDAGVRVLSCGTCLDYFHLKDNLKVGQVTNMQDTVAALMTADWVVRP